ncbi:MAG: CoA transferase subunit A [Dehalococcoidia bacterium]
MPVDKVYPSAADAVRDISDGATVMIDGFGGPGGMPGLLILALRDHGARDLTIIGNTAGLPGFGARKGQAFVNTSILYENKQVRKAIASFPVPRSASNKGPFERGWLAGEVELEVTPQGTLAERIRAGGAGIAAFYTPTATGTLLAQGKEVRRFDGREYVLERALTADFALIRARRADRMGNLVYQGTSRNFNPIMATAAAVTIVEADEIVEPGDLAPETIVTPGLFVDRIVLRPKETP